MTAEQWADLFRQVAEDIRENKAPPKPVTTGDLADTLERVSANLPAIILTLREHQGIEAAAADILQALADAGVPHAADIRSALLAFPGALEKADKYLPIILATLQAFQPVPSWRPGPRVER